MILEDMGSVLLKPLSPAHVPILPISPPLSLSIWNSTFMKRSSIAILPYCQALAKFPAHIQQVQKLGGFADGWGSHW